MALRAEVVSQGVMPRQPRGAYDPKGPLDHSAKLTAVTLDGFWLKYLDKSCGLGV